MPVEPSREIPSPSLNTLPARVKRFFSSSIFMSPQPETQHVPMPRATTAACEVCPPRTVRIPCAYFIPSISSGEVSRRTKTTFLPFLPSVTASSAVKTICPAAAPGEAAIPLPTTFDLSAASSALWSNWGCKSISRDLASICINASSSVIIFSSIKSHAILIAAAAVRLPLRVCNI